MPLYEYQCQDCQTQLELLVRGAERPTCPECGGTQLAKQLSVVAAPARDDLPVDSDARPTGPCGSACECFPEG